MARRDLIVVVDSAVARKKQQVAKKDELYLGTADSEHIEM
jgi:hypothetical protein